MFYFISFVYAKASENSLNSKLEDKANKETTPVIRDLSRGEWNIKDNHIAIQYIIGTDGSKGIGFFIDGTLYAVIPLVRLSES